MLSYCRVLCVFVCLHHVYLKAKLTLLDNKMPSVHPSKVTLCTQLMFSHHGRQFDMS